VFWLLTIVFRQLKNYCESQLEHVFIVFIQLEIWTNQLTANNFKSHPVLVVLQIIIAGSSLSVYSRIYFLPRHQTIIDDPRFAVFDRWKSSNCLGRGHGSDPSVRGECFTMFHPPFFTTRINKGSIWIRCLYNNLIHDEFTHVKHLFKLSAIIILRRPWGQPGFLVTWSSGWSL
jgi:hypothetical protein